MTIVHLPSGDIRGIRENQNFVFKGIPYAEPLAGAARWLPPQPRRPWQGVRSAEAYGVVHTQFNVRSPGPLPRARKKYFDVIAGAVSYVEGDDCLVLNVWTPSLDLNARLPVMVYIHGGGFTSGAANELYHGGRFADKGVVYVAIQYRLGPPGFLHGEGLFDGEFCSNNRAFLDQICALKWVQENIGLFGGDASQVTIFGESAGAFSVYQLAASPMAKGLFCRAIAMGGMAETCAPAVDHLSLTREVLSEAGIKAGDKEALTAMRMPELQKMQAAITGKVYKNKDPNRYGMLGRTKIGAMGAATGTSFLPFDPLTAFRSGASNDIELMLGTCADDGQLFSLFFPLPGLISARLFMSVLSGLMPRGEVKPALDYYRLKMPGTSLSRRYDQINNDAFYRMPTIAAAEAHASGRGNRTYHYELDVQSGIAGLRAIHGIDVALLFGPQSPTQKLLKQDTETAIVSRQFLDAFVSFAKGQKPHALGLPEWASYDAVTRPTMVFNRVSRMENDWAGELRKFWATADA